MHADMIILIFLSKRRISQKNIVKCKINRKKHGKQNKQKYDKQIKKGTKDLRVCNKNTSYTTVIISGGQGG